MSDPAARPQAAGDPEQFLAEFQASRSYLAGGVRGGGWLDFGQFNWHDVALGRAIRAALGALFAATDRLVDAVNTVADILRTHLAPARPSPAS